MPETFDRQTFFDMVRHQPFPDSLSEDQVSGMDAILSVWENIPILFPNPPKLDIRWLAYMLATTFHETGASMQPIEEWGKGEGHDYGEVDPETGQTYYGRGFVQLTWRDNYAKATKELGIEPKSEEDLEWHAEVALEPNIAAGVMFQGMYQGWFRGDEEGRQTLPRYFNATTDDPYHARDIINGDIEKNAKMIEGYHDDFLLALQAASEAKPAKEKLVIINVQADPGVKVQVQVNGEPVA